MDRGVWWAIVHGVTKSWIQLSTHTHIYIHSYYKVLLLGEISKEHIALLCKLAISMNL